MVSEYSNIGVQYDGIWLTFRYNCCNDENQFQRTPIQLPKVCFDTNFFPDFIRPCERISKENSLWFYSCLVKCFLSFSSSSILCLMRWKINNVWHVVRFGGEFLIRGGKKCGFFPPNTFLSIFTRISLLMSRFFYERKVRG